jgi:lon-related putative ATP-dependent protease
MAIKPLEPGKLRLVTDPARLPFDSTAALQAPLAPAGQDRAMRALMFGAGMAQPGFNVFVTGPRRSGQRDAVRQALERLAAAMPAPPDIVYVHNFDAPQRPRMLRFASGEGAQFRAGLAEFVAELKTAKPGDVPALRSLIAPLAHRFNRHREAHAHIGCIYQDAVKQIGDVPVHRYVANVIVDSGAARGAPVVSLSRPSLANLVGRVDHVTVLMSVVADHRHIRPGALHAANGGFLLVDALDLVRQEAAWEALKRALRSRSIRIESLSELHDRVPAQPLHAEPVPLDVKVVLFGEAWTYHRLAQADPDFAALFKVQADFSNTAPRDDTNCADLLGTMAGIARAEGVKQLDRSGAARLIDEAARLSGDAERIDVRTDLLADLVREADHYAAVAGRSLIAGEDVARAVEAREDRTGRAKALERERVARRIVLIDTEGAAVGQVNALTIASAGGASFGMPVRLTAQAAPGDGRVIDIEREARLGGPVHAKGVQILSGYLNGAYAIGRPLSVAASIAFEQTYGPVDGDSASAAELIAILSAIAGVPVKQSIAITGSINQHGQMQPIGGANEKIEGYFDVCAARGLSGRQGVVIPKANGASLMLREDVVSAAGKGLFAVYAVETIDEAIGVLTGMTPGRKGRNGKFQRGSFNRRVQDRLIDFARPRVLKPVHLDPWWRI